MFLWCIDTLFPEQNWDSYIQLTISIVGYDMWKVLIFNKYIPSSTSEFETIERAT